MLREALAKGADEVIRIAFDEAAAYDVGKVSRLLAAAIRTMPHDLVLTGVQSDDLVNSATGGLVAGLLNLPHASVVTRVEVKGNGLEVACELEGGLQRLYSIALPAVLTIQFGANTPRYAPLPAIMKAARQPIKEFSPAALGFASWDAVPLPRCALRTRCASPRRRPRRHGDRGPPRGRSGVGGIHARRIRPSGARRRREREPPSYPRGPHVPRLRPRARARRCDGSAAGHELSRLALRWRAPHRHPPPAGSRRRRISL